MKSLHLLLLVMAILALGFTLFETDLFLLKLAAVSFTLCFIIERIFKLIE